jgi:HEAT repeat protein
VSMASRKRAAEALGGFGAIAGVVAGLEAALVSDTTWPVRGQAAGSLGKIRSDAARDILIDRLPDEPESRARCQIIEALGEFKGDSKVAAALKNQFRRDSSYYARANALKSVVKIEAKDAFDMCIRALKTDSHREIIRSAALESLVEVKDRQGIDHILKWSEYGRPDPAREAAVGAMGTLGEADWYDGDEVLERLIELLDDRYFRVERKSIEALGD